MTVVRLNSNRKRTRCHTAVTGLARLPRPCLCCALAATSLLIFMTVGKLHDREDSIPTVTTRTSNNVAARAPPGGLRSSVDIRQAKRKENKAGSNRSHRNATRPSPTDRIGPNLPPRKDATVGLSSSLEVRPIREKERTGSITNHIQHQRNTTTGGWPSECSLYLAESTIPNSGLGMFTAIDLGKGVSVPSPDITIPVIDINWHNDNLYQAGGYHLMYENYFWTAGSLGLSKEAEVIGVMSMGFGALANSHLGLKNLDEGYPVFGAAGLHRSRDPGAGSFCPYHGRKAKTTASVPAGAELFVDYGESWFESRADDLGYIPLEKDYKRADNFLKKYAIFRSDNMTDMSESMKSDFWDLIVNFNNESRTLNALPNTTKVAKVATEKGVLSTVRKIRSPDWLKKNGKCLDNIRPGRSTIKQAGRGAFATRLIPKGTIVISTPLIHIPRGRDVFKMYSMDEAVNGANARNASRAAAGHQLIMNYCFGNRDSTVMLSPYGPSVSFINHNGEAPNAEIRWADPSSGWFNHSVEWLETQFRAGLAFDFVATRDIFPGEEVFIDYGAAWQKAWDGHARRFEPPPNSEDYKRAAELNKDAHFLILRTQDEQLSNPYPSHVETHCRYTLPKRQAGSLTDARYDRSWKVGDQSMSLYPCEILSRSNITVGGDALVYSARILNHETRLGRFGDLEKSPGVPKGETHLLTNIPRRGIELVDKMYSSDMHLPNAFRHEILIPDEIFPKAWKNLRMPL